MDADADVFVKKCLSCTLVSKTDPPPPLHRTELPSQAWEFVAIDYMGPLPSGEHILVVVDYFSRFVELAFTRSTSASETIRLLWKIFACHGFPVRLKSDNAQAFHSHEFQSFLADYGIEHVTSPPLWPQANGEVERQNRSILKRLKIAHSEGLNMEIEVYKFILSYNSTPHSTTGVAPAQLLFQRQLRDRLPSILLPSVQRESIVDRDAQKKFQGKITADCRRRASPSTIQPGDSVLIPAKQTDKLSPTFEKEPFRVLATDGKEVQLQRGSQQLRRSVAAVKRVVSPEPESISPASPTPQRSYAAVVAGTPNPPPTPPSATVHSALQRSPTLSTGDSSSSRPSSAPSSPFQEPFRGFDTSVSSAPPTASVPCTRSGRSVRPPTRLDL